MDKPPFVEKGPESKNEGTKQKFCNFPMNGSGQS